MCCMHVKGVVFRCFVFHFDEVVGFLVKGAMPARSGITVQNFMLWPSCSNGIHIVKALFGGPLEIGVEKAAEEDQSPN